MKNFIPFEKLSKKEKKAINAAKRGSWGDVNPVSRVPANPKAYNRSKRKAADRRDSGGCFA